ncbi:MAG: peptidylprolyl isomerase [bacterium]|nr:peptidylprolyl isomerase [bacterium]
MKKFLLMATCASLVGSNILAQAAEQRGPKPDQVVAVVNGQKRTVEDLVKLLSMLPPQLRQAPLPKLFPMLRAQLVSEILLAKAAETSNIESDPDVQKVLEEVKNRALVNALISKMVKAKVNDQTVKVAYDKYVKEHPRGKKEARVRHILVETEAKANDVIAALESGADFEKLAREQSKDGGSAQKGGDLGYFVEEQMVPEFSKAAFELSVGKMTLKPIKTGFGWHIIKKLDERDVKPGKFEEVKPSLMQALSQEAVGEYVESLRKGADIQVFALDGTADTEPTTGLGANPIA